MSCFNRDESHKTCSILLFEWEESKRNTWCRWRGSKIVGMCPIDAPRRKWFEAGVMWQTRPPNKWHGGATSTNCVEPMRAIGTRVRRVHWRAHAVKERRMHHGECLGIDTKIPSSKEVLGAFPDIRTLLQHVNRPNIKNEVWAQLESTYVPSVLAPEEITM